MSTLLTPEAIKRSRKQAELSLTQLANENGLPRSNPFENPLQDPSQDMPSEPSQDSEKHTALYCVNTPRYTFKAYIRNYRIATRPNCLFFNEKFGHGGDRSNVPNGALKTRREIAQEAGVEKSSPNGGLKSRVRHQMVYRKRSDRRE